MGNDSGDLSVQEREANVSAQLEELEALEAIYGEGYEAVRGSAASPQLRIRVSEIPLVSLHLRLPVGYPSRDFPELEIKAPGLGQAARRKLFEALLPSASPSSEPVEVAKPSPGGTVVVFDWVETLRDLLSRTDYTSDSPAADGGDDNDGDEKTVSTLTATAGKFDEDEEEGEEPLEAEQPAEEYVEIFHGQAFTDRKSTFQAHLARVSSESQVTWVRRRLMEIGKVARATHNVAAWRVWDEGRGVQLHDNDDDGNGAGSRLAHMLAITGAQNVVVVVSRWYGGIHLGPDRFKHINNAARELLVYCGATKADGEVAGGGRGGKTRARRKRGSGGGGS
ncbi:unnamed protein product [Ectocarpus sp. 12 AP-2014]